MGDAANMEASLARLQTIAQKFEEPKKERSVTKVYFLYSPKGDITTVKKKSVHGNFLKVSHKLARVFGFESDLDKGKRGFIQDVQNAIALVQKDPKVDDNKIKSLHTLLTRLEKVESFKDVASSRRSITRKVPEIAQKISAITQSDQKEKRKAIEEMLKKLTIPVDDDICAFLALNADIGYLTTITEKIGTHGIDERFVKEELHLAIMKEYMQLPEASHVAFQKLLTYTEAKQTIKSGLVEFKNVALVLGDAFLSDTSIEGDISSTRYAELASQYIRSLPESARSERVKNLEKVCSRENVVALSCSKDRDSKAVQKQIQKNIQENGRCLLDGGFKGHAIVYEIEKTANGKYAFRIYNEGQGIGHHISIETKYKTKHAACVGVCDLSEEQLFGTPFLNGLGMLTGIEGEEAKDLLYGSFLDNLGGTREGIRDDVHYFVSEQRSGTCTYRSFQAFLANSLSVEEYKGFKIGYKAFLLERYKEELEKELLSPIQDDEEYRKLVQQFGILKESIAKFANNVAGVDNRKHIECQKAERIILEYQHILHNFEQKLQTYEKQKVVDVTGLSNTVTSAVIPSPKKMMPELKITPSTQGNDVSTVEMEIYLSLALTSIEKLDVNNKGLIKICVEILAGYAKRGNNKDLYVVLNAFFKKVGSFDQVQELLSTFTEADDNRKLSEQFTTILSQVMSDTENQSLEKQLTTFLLYYATEELFRKLPDEKRVIPQDFTTFLSQMKIQTNAGVPKEQLNCSDPFWLSCLKDFEKLQEQKETGFSVPDYTNTALILDAKMQDSILQWWEKHASSDAITESIKNDRIAQKIEIEKRIKEIEGSIEGIQADIDEEERDLEKTQKAIVDFLTKHGGNKGLQENSEKITKLQNEIISFKITSDPEVMKALQEKHKEIAEYRAIEKSFLQLQEQEKMYLQNIEEEKREIDRLKLHKDRMPDLVHKDTKYWPWGWENDTFSQERKAHFLFTNGFNGRFFQYKGLDCALPDEFVLFYGNNVGVVNSSFHAKKNFNTADISRSLSKEQDQESTSIKIDGRLVFEKSQKKVNSYEADFIDSGWESFQKRIFDKDDNGKYVYNELNVIRDGHIAPGITNEEMKNIFAIRNGALRVASLTSYFTEHREFLQDKKWVVLFHALLFESTILLDLLQDPKERKATIELLDKFFQEVETQAKEDGNYAVIGTTLWLRAIVQGYITQTAQEGDKKIFSFDVAIQHMKEAAKQENRAYWPEFFRSFLAAAGTSSKIELTDRQQGFLFLAQIASRKNPVASEKSIALQDSSIDLVEKYTQQFFEDNAAKDMTFTEEYNAFLDRMFPGIGTFTKEAGSKDIFVSQDGETKMALSSGSIASKNPKLFEAFSYALSEREKTVLMGVEEKYYTKQELSRLRCQQDDKRVLINDPVSGTNMCLTNDQVYVKTKVLDKYVWACRSTSEEIGIEKKVRELGENYEPRVVNSTVYLCVPNTEEALYKIENGIVTDLKTQYVLVDTAVKPVFEHFEDASWISVWKDSHNEPKKITFGRLGALAPTQPKDPRKEKKEEVQKKEEVSKLSFEIDSTGKWQCKEKEGWFLAEEQFISHIGPETGFLVLENGKGEKNVLIPLWEPKPPEEGKASKAFNFSFDFQANVEKGKGQYVSFDVQNGKLIPKSPEARFYLGRIYLEKGFQDEAEALLLDREAEITKGVLTEEARDILISIVNDAPPGTMTSRAIKTRMHVLYLLRKNEGIAKAQGIQYTHTTNVKAKKEKRLIKEYLGRLKHIQPMDSMREQVLLESVVEKTTQIDHRIQELQAGTPLDKTIELTIPERNVRNPVAVSAIHERPPGLLDRFRYFISRVQNEFPFDVTDDEKSILQYAALIEEECRTSKYTELQKSGLLSTLHYLELQSKDKKVQKFAADCLNIVYQKRPEISSHIASQKTEIESGFDANKVQKKTSAEETKKRSLQDLQMIPTNVEAPIEAKKKFLDDFSCYTQVEKSIEGTQGTKALFRQGGIEDTDEYNKIFQDMRDDVQEAKKQEVLTYIVDIDALEQKLEQLPEEKKKLTEQERNLLLAVTSALTIDQKSALEFASKKRALPTIEELCFLAASRDATKRIREMYPEISEDGAKKLQESVKEYLIQKTLVQHLTSIEKKMTDMAVLTDPTDRHIAEQSLGALLHARPAYTDEDTLSITLLSIEALLGYTLRPKQVANIKTFYNAIISENPLDQNVIQQMLMGAGKTSVLLPVLSFLLAKEGDLSTVYVPESLFPEVSSALSRVLGNAYNRYVFHQEMDRELGKNNEYLEVFLKGLEDTKEVGGVLLLTPKQKLSIYSSFKEAYAESLENKSPELTERIQLLTTICSFINENERNQVDEVELVTDPTVTFKYPIGAPQAVDKVRAATVTDMLSDLTENKEFYEQFSFDFIDQFQKRCNPGYVKKGKVVTKDDYDTQIKPFLHNSAIKQLSRNEVFKQRYALDLILKEYVNSFLDQTTPYDKDLEALQITEEEKTKIQVKLQEIVKREELIQKLKDVTVGSPEWLFIREKLFIMDRKSHLEAVVPQEFLDVLGQCSKAICVHMRNTLFKECGVDYGKDPAGKYIIRSYSAPDAPKPSVPSDPYELTLYSKQAVLYYGVPKDAVKKIFISWQRSARLEPSIPLEEQDSYKEFQRVLGDRAALFKFQQAPSDELLNVLQECLSRDPESIKMFMKEYVFEQAHVYPKSIETKSAPIVQGMNKSSFGFSGTVNKGIFASNIQVNAEPGTDGLTINAVQKKIEAGTSGIRCFKNESLIEQVEQDFLRPDVYVFTDSGNWTKEVVLETWAEKLVHKVHDKRADISGVVYPNKKNEWMIAERLSSGEVVHIPLSRSSLSPSQRITIIPSKNETGTDIAQPPTAKNILSIRRGMSKRDALQSIFRMRQILEGQNVEFLIAEEVKDDIAGMITKNLLLDPEFGPILQSDDLKVSIEHLKESERFKERLENSPEDIQKGVKNLFENLGKVSNEEWGRYNKNNREQLISRYFNEGFSIHEGEVLWHYLVKNQHQAELQKNWQATQDKMQDVLEKPIREMLFGDEIKDFSQKQALFEALQKIFLPKSEDSAFNDMTSGIQVIGQEQAIMRAKETVKGYFIGIVESAELDITTKRAVCKQIITLYDPSQRIDVETCTLQDMKNLQSILEGPLERCVDREAIPKTMTVSNMASGESEEVQEAQVDTDIDIQVDVESTIEQEVLQEITIQHGTPTFVPYVDLSTISPKGGYALHPLLNNDKFIPGSIIPESLCGIISQDEYRIRFSTNLFPGFELASLSNTTCNHILIREHQGEKSIVLVNSEDADKIVRGMNEKQQLPGGAVIQLVSLDGKVSKKVPQDGKDILSKESLEKAIIQAKILSGKVIFTKEQIKRLSSMIDNEPSPSATANNLIALYKDILSCMPTSAALFGMSPINKLLKEKAKVGPFNFVLTPEQRVEIKGNIKRMQEKFEENTTVGLHRDQCTSYNVSVGKGPRAYYIQDRGKYKNNADNGIAISFGDSKSLPWCEGNPKAIEDDLVLFCTQAIMQQTTTATTDKRVDTALVAHKMAMMLWKQKQNNPDFVNSFTYEVLVRATHGLVRHASTGESVAGLPLTLIMEHLEKLQNSTPGVASDSDWIKTRKDWFQKVF